MAERRYAVMALSRVKTWNAAETLTAADLNAEFNNICNHFGSIDNDDVVSTASYVLGELVIGAGITSADGGQLHVYTASAGSVQAHADADEGVFENSGNSGITILSGASNTGNIHFGDTDNDIGKISYNHSTNGFTVTANNATAAAISSAGVLTTGGNIVSDTDSTDDLGTTSVRWANVYTDAIGDSGQALGVKATTFSFDAASTIDTSGNNNLTLSAGTATLGVTAGDVTIFDDNNNADTSLSIGTSATEALKIEVLNGTSTKTAEEIKISTATASGTANHGKISIYIDGTEIMDIDDGGIDMAAGMSVAVDGTDLTSGSGISWDGSTANGVATFKDSDEATVESNLTFGSDILTATSTSSNLPKVELKNTNADGTAGILQFTKDSASGADSDLMGTIQFYGTDASNNTEEPFAKIEGIIAEADHGSETGKLAFSVAENDGTVTTGLTVTGSADEDGLVVIDTPQHPSFMAYNDGHLAGVTGNATNYTAVFNQERWDVGADQVNGVFTAPVDGRYFFMASIMVDGITTDTNEAMSYIVTSNFSYIIWHSGEISNNTWPFGGQTFNGSCVADMERGDTAHVTVEFRGQGSALVRVMAHSRFEGHLLTASTGT